MRAVGAQIPAAVAVLQPGLPSGLVLPGLPSLRAGGVGGAVWSGGAGCTAYSLGGPPLTVLGSAPWLLGGAVGGPCHLAPLVGMAGQAPFCLSPVGPSPFMAVGPGPQAPAAGPGHIVGGKAWPLLGRIRAQQAAAAAAAAAPRDHGGVHGRDTSEYAAGLAQAYTVAQAQWADGGRRVDSAGAEFSAWLQALRPPGDVFTCTTRVHLHR